LAAANSVSLDPFTIGGRLLLLGNNFLQYRIVRGRLTYVPDGSSNGIVEIVSGATAAPTYAARPFAIGILKDPALSTVQYNAILDAGGKYGNTSKGKVLTIGPSGWLWTSTTSASPTTIDLRMSAFGKLYFAFFNASTTATVSFGHIIVQLDVEFKGVVYNAAALGTALAPPPQDVPSTDEAKTSTVATGSQLSRAISKPALIEITQSKAGGWF
jgi:hypothetical protein